MASEEGGQYRCGGMGRVVFVDLPMQVEEREGEFVGGF